MAIYEYRCEKCGKDVEEMTMGLNNKKAIECPYCKGTATKIISSGSFVVNGFNQSNSYAGNMR